MKLLISAILLTVVLLAQTPVAIQATAQVNGQTVTLTSNTITKKPLLTGTLTCPSEIIAGSTAMCTMTINLIPGGDVVIPVTSLNTKDFTVPATVTLKSGSTTVLVPVTATP